MPENFPQTEHAPSELILGLGPVNILMWVESFSVYNNRIIKISDLLAALHRSLEILTAQFENRCLERSNSFVRKFIFK